MNLGMYGILIIFGAFVLLLIFNPNLSCFGKRIKSPLYPILRKKNRSQAKQVKTEDYGFDLGGDKSQAHAHKSEQHPVEKIEKAEDYGFNLKDEDT